MFFPQMTQRNWKTSLIDFLENNRGLVILFFCLPASFLFDLILSLRAKVYRLVFSSPGNHDKRVRKIQSQIQMWNKSPKESRKLLCTSRPNWLSLSTTFYRKDLCHRVNIDLFDILDLDERNLTVRVEPMVTVGEITQFLIPRGYTLAVTLEIADATLGGLAMGKTKIRTTKFSTSTCLYQNLTYVFTFFRYWNDNTLTQNRTIPRSDRIIRGCFRRWIFNYSLSVAKR